MMKYTDDDDPFKRLKSETGIEPIAKLSVKLNYVYNSDCLGLGSVDL
jgi:hypothetical protein